MKNKFDTVLEKKFQEQQSQYSLRKWCRTNKHKVFREVLFPIWIIFMAREKASEHIYSHLQWSEARTIRLLDKSLPPILEIDGNELCYCLEWNDPWLYGSHIPIWNRSYGRKFRSAIIDYLKADYQVHGYDKRLETISDFEHWIIFKKDKK